MKYRNYYQQASGDKNKIKETLKILNYEEFTEYDEIHELITYKFELYQWVTFDELFTYQESHKDILQFKARIFQIKSNLDEFVIEMNNKGIYFNRIRESTIFLNLKDLTKFCLTNIECQREQVNNKQDLDFLQKYLNQLSSNNKVSQIRVSQVQELQVIQQKKIDCIQKIEIFVNQQQQKFQKYDLQLENNQFFNQIIVLVKNDIFISQNHDYNEEDLLEIALNINYMQNKIKDCISTFVTDLEQYFQKSQINKDYLEQKLSRNIYNKLAQYNFLNDSSIYKPLLQDDKQISDLIKIDLFSFITQIIEELQLKVVDTYILMKNYKNSIKLFGLIIFSKLNKNQIFNKEQIQFMYTYIMQYFNESYSICKYMLQNQLQKIFIDVTPFNDCFNNNQKKMLNELYGEFSNYDIDLDQFLNFANIKIYVNKLFEDKYFEKMKELVKTVMLQQFKLALKE